MQDFYPYLLEKKNYIQDLITKEELKFIQTLSDGEKKLEEWYEKNKAISGEDAFILYDTYGFPFELTEEFAKEKGVHVNHADFEKAMERQKENARERRNVQSSMNLQNASYLAFKQPSEFIGYRYFNTTAKVIAIFEKNPLQVVFDKTPFYAEMGGEIADAGTVESDSFLGKVVHVLKMPNGQHLHQIEVIKGELNVEDTVFLHIDEKKRMAIEKNHSATHLMHQALKDVLGEHVQQQGSFVSDENLRFDFNHFKNITSEELLQVEQIVNQKIQEQINNTEDSNISISLGSFTGISLLSGKGPRIPIEISTIGNISTNFKSEFIEKGINQTLHRLYLEIECEISILTPFNTINEKIKNEFLIAENIIVGNIPDAYYNIKGVTANDALEVVE